MRGPGEPRFQQTADEIFYPAMADGCQVENSNPTGKKKYECRPQGGHPQPHVLHLLTMDGAKTEAQDRKQTQRIHNALHGPRRESSHPTDSRLSSNYLSPHDVTHEN